MGGKNKPAIDKTKAETARTGLVRGKKGIAAKGGDTDAVVAGISGRIS
jgi:hypothetical protein